jgi:hypothetical protein
MQEKPRITWSGNSIPSRAFFEEVKEVVNRLDSDLNVLLHSYGYKVWVPRRLTELFPQAKTWKIPHDGQDHSKTGVNSPDGMKGCHIRNYIVIPEFYLADSGEWVPNRKYSLPNLIMHEFGHGLDGMPHWRGYKRFSEREAFKEAYRKDIAAIAEADKEKLDMHLNDSARSHSEVFAQAVSTILFPGEEHFERYRKCFPGCFAYVQVEVLGKLKNFDEAILDPAERHSLKERLTLLWDLGFQRLPGPVRRFLSRFGDLVRARSAAPGWRALFCRPPA